MTRRHLTLAALLTLAVALPRAQTELGIATAADELAADVESATRYAVASTTGASLIYDDPEVVSLACAGAVDPLDCTAQEGASVLEQDAAADEMPLDLDILAPDLSSDSSAGTDGLASSELVDAVAAPDSVTAVDPEDTTSLAPLDTTSLAPDEASIIAAATVRPMERGFNTRQEADYVGDGTDRFERAMNEIDGTGVVVHRLAVFWWDVQCRGAGTWNWSKYDQVVSAAHARGMRVILNPTGSPNWARIAARRTPTQPDDPCAPTIALGPFAHPDNLSAWRVFVRELALRYAPYDPIGYEIWNEENSRNFWDPTATHQAPSPSGWTRLYCGATGQIDQVNPAPVGMGGLAVYRNSQFDLNLNGRLKNMKTSTFLNRAYTARVSICPGKTFDFVGYHPYAYAAYYDGRNPLMKDTPAMRELVDVRKVMRARGQGTRKVWNTEWGFPSDFRGITEARQANLIRREHVYLASARDAYGYFMRFSVLFNPIDSPSGDLWGHIGVVWIDPNRPADTTLWRRKPSYATWTALP
jgi:hypothetical protein